MPIKPPGATPLPGPLPVRAPFPGERNPAPGFVLHPTPVPVRGPAVPFRIPASSNAAPDLQKPGETPHGPGPREERGPRGGEVDNPRHPNISPDTPKLPPTQAPGHTWIKQEKK